MDNTSCVHAVMRNRLGRWSSQNPLGQRGAPGGSRARPTADAAAAPTPTEIARSRHVRSPAPQAEAKAASAEAATSPSDGKAAANAATPPSSPTPAAEEARAGPERSASFVGRGLTSSTPNQMQETATTDADSHRAKSPGPMLSPSQAGWVAERTANAKPTTAVKTGARTAGARPPRGNDGPRIPRG